MSTTVMMLAAAAAEAAAQAPAVEAPSPLLAYVSPVFLLLWAAALCAICAGIHSVLGEQKLLRPQLAAPTGVLENPLARQVTRLAWQLRHCGCWPGLCSWPQLMAISARHGW